MAQLRVNPTRMELLRLKKRAALATKGHKLLKEKRDGLMQEFLTLMREVKVLRAEVDEEFTKIVRHFFLAQASMDNQAVIMLSLLKLQGVVAQVVKRNVMGVIIPEFAIEPLKAEAAYPWWETSPELDVALSRFRKILPSMLKLAAQEKSAELLAQEIETTRRRVNALEHVLLPQLNNTTRYIRMKLEEQGRAAIVTTMKVKQELVIRH